MRVAGADRVNATAAAHGGAQPVLAERRRRIGPAPVCLTAAELDRPPNGARVSVAGLVICRQRPGTAKGVIFITLEDETGTANIVVWAQVYERFRRAVIAGRCLRITGKVQREGDVIHLVAQVIEDISPLLDAIVHVTGPAAPAAEAAGPRS